MKLCNECGRVNGHSPLCPELSSESAMRAAAKRWGFNPSAVIEDGEADILDECGVLIGGCYTNE
mgnify:CR=1 FL=1